MRRIASFVLSLALAGCQTTGYQEYALALTRIAEAQAQVAREQTIAMAALARDPGADQTTKTVAVLMLALGVQGSKTNIQLAPPQNEALQWAQTLLPTMATLGLGYWGYRLGTTQSNNGAQVSIAGYNAMSGIAGSGFQSVSSTAGAGFNALTQFKPLPIDWASVRPDVTTTITNNGNGVIGSGSTNNGNGVQGSGSTNNGNGTLGSGSTNNGNGVIGDGSVDNSNRPVVVVPPVVPIVPVVVH